MELTAAILAFFALLALACAVCSGDNRSSQAQQLIRRMARPDLDEAAGESARSRKRIRQRRALELTLGRINLLQTLEREMWQAGLYTPLADLLLYSVLLFGAGIGGGLLISHYLSIGVSAGIAAALLPPVYVKIRRWQRLATFESQLPELLDLVKSSLEVGHSLARGLQVAVDECADPMRTELRMLLEQTRFGIPLPRAFEDMLKRVPSDSLRFMVIAIKIQAAIGSSLADILGRLAETIRARQRIHLQIRALTAQPRMSGTIVGLLPVVVLAFFAIIQPSYAGLMFRDPLGFKILKLAIALDVTAFVVIRRVLKSDY